MFSFVGRKNEKTRAPAVEPHALTFSSMAMVGALVALSKSDPSAIPEDLPPELRETLRSLQIALRGRDESMLRQTVEYSIKASEAMAASARITGEIRETDGRAQAIAAGVEEMTASIDQISATARDIAQSMETASSAMQAGTAATAMSADASRKIGASFRSMSSAADALAEAAQQIGTFVSTIEALAQQTNLLALNATIEAARAGEAGRGFAVVASEVKALSGQTQRATDDIRTRIVRLETHVKEVMDNVVEVSGLVEESVARSEDAERQIVNVRQIVDGNTGRITDIAGLLDQQNQAVAEISRGVQAIAHHSRLSAGFADETLTMVGASEKIIAEQFAELESRNVPNYVLHRAKSDHLMWKKHLAEMMVGLKVIKAGELADHHQCRLGKWYDAVTDERLRRNPNFAALMPAHEAVHTNGRRAADLHQAGDRTGALAAFEAMNRSSTEVLAHLDALIRG